MLHFLGRYSSASYDMKVKRNFLSQVNKRHRVCRKFYAM